MKQLHADSCSHERGVSLIEMIVVLALIGLMAMVTIPNFISIYQSSRVKAVARTTIGDIRNARQLAISSNARSRISFNTGTNVHHYEVFRERKDRLTNTSTWQQVRRGDLGSVVYIQSTNFPDQVTGDDTVRDIVYLPNGTLQPLDSAIAPPYHMTLRTEQSVAKKDYRLEFTTSGNVTLQ